MDPGMAGFFAGAPGDAARRPANKGRFSLIRDFYDDPFKWGIVKSITFFAGGILIARQLRGFDVMSVVQAPPPGMLPAY